MKPGSLKKITLCVILGLFLLLVIAYFGRPLYLPDSTIISFIEDKISSETGYLVDIESGHFRLFKESTLNNIVLQDSSQTFSASLHRLVASFEILPLLRKRLVLDELSLDNPVINISSSSSLSSAVVQSSEHSSTVSVDSSGITPQVDATTSTLPFDFDLPIEILLKKLNIHNAEIYYELIYDSTFVTANLQGLNVYGGDIFVQDVTTSDIRFVVDLNDTLDLSYESPDFTFQSSSPVEFTLDGLINSQKSILSFSSCFTPQLYITSSRIDLPQMKCNVRMTMSGFDNLSLDSLNILFGDRSHIAANGSMEDVWSEGKYSLTIHDGHLDLTQLKQQIQQFTSILEQSAALEDINLTGSLRLSNTNFTGYFSRKYPELHGQLNWDLININLDDREIGIKVDNLNVRSQISGQFLPSDQYSTQFNAEIHVDSIDYLTEFTDIPISISEVALTCQGGVNPQMKMPFLNVAWRGNAPYQCDFAGNISCTAEILDISDPLESPGLSIIGGSSLNDIPLEMILPEHTSGSLSLAADFNVTGLDDVNLQLGALCPKLSLKYGDKVLIIPAFTTTSNIHAEVSRDLKNISAENIEIRIPSYANASFTASIDSSRNWKVDDLSCDLNLTEVMEIVYPMLPPQLAGISVDGELGLSGYARGNLNDPLASLSLESELKIEPANLNLPYYNLTLDSLSTVIEITSNNKTVKISSRMNIGSIAIPTLRPQPYREASIDFQTQIRNYTQYYGGSLRIKLPEIGLQAETFFQPASASGQLPEGLSMDLQFASTTPVTLLEGLITSGKADAEISFSMLPDSIYRTSGIFNTDSLNLHYADDFDIAGLSLHIPFDFQVGKAGGNFTIIQLQNKLYNLDDPVRFRTVQHLIPTSGEFGSFNCSYLRMMDHELTNLDATIQVKGNGFNIPDFYSESYGGNITGSLAVGLTALDPDSLYYSFIISANDLNSAFLPGADRNADKEGKISAFTNFRGQGIDYRSKIHLDGGMKITRIGQGVADNILRFLDPDQVDPSIQTYRRYIRQGWGVKVFSFDVKDDFVYVSVTPTKPPITKPGFFILSRLVGLGKHISFGRLPLRYFLNPGQTQ
ncbi:hypothetical protein CEE37_12980 [candidate division LCP-89 bacterium B3_LCP]|uniref:Uncharacterized protein n=1 Tax=candidate division LCP-89 bacterium B3_LCP TaxID=2012998 RepID=A0A532UTZ7_UNCL8|nr:MAG: hypothetical protein CEE37_12980 [candidate division LCP-89 bacterium B3_LCP]